MVFFRPVNFYRSSLFNSFITKTTKTWQFKVSRGYSLMLVLSSCCLQGLHNFITRAPPLTSPFLGLTNWLFAMLCIPRRGAADSGIKSQTRFSIFLTFPLTLIFSVTNLCLHCHSQYLSAYSGSLACRNLIGCLAKVKSSKTKASFAAGI